MREGAIATRPHLIRVTFGTCELKVKYSSGSPFVWPGASIYVD